MNVSKTDDIARIQLTQVSDSTKQAYWISWKKEYYTEIPFQKYSIKETDFRVKTAKFTSPSYIDLTTGLRVIRIVSKYHENFAGVVLDSSYDEDTGVYEYQCQDMSRLFMGVVERFSNNVSIYGYLISLITGGAVPLQNPTKTQLNNNKVILSGLRSLPMYDQSNYPGNVYKGNPFKQTPQYMIRDKTRIEAIRDIVYSSLGYFDVWINDNGILQIEPLSKTDWESTGLQLHAYDIMERKFKFSTTNAITGVLVNGDGLSAGKVYRADSLLGIDLWAFFGRVGASVANPIKKTNATKTTSTKTTTNTKGNPYGNKAKKIWIGADGGSGSFTKEIISYLNKAGWSCHYSGEGANVHYEDYFNVTKDYQVLAIVDNGFDPATVMEPYEGSIKSELANKGVICMFFFDTRDWTNPDGMKPYRYGNFKGYYAHRAWDDNYSNFSGSLNVDDYFRKNKIKYCANPSAKGMVDQFVAGGYYAYNNIKV